MKMAQWNIPLAIQIPFITGQCAYINRFYPKKKDDHKSPEEMASHKSKRFRDLTI